MASTDIQLLFLVISNYYKKTIHTNGIPYNVSICVISKSGKKSILSSNTALLW